MITALKETVHYYLLRTANRLRVRNYDEVAHTPVKMFARTKNGLKEITADLVELQSKKNEEYKLLTLRDKSKEIGSLYFIHLPRVNGIEINFLDCLKGLKKYKGASNILTRAVFEKGLQKGSLPHIQYSLVKTGYGKTMYSEALVKGLGVGRTSVPEEKMMTFIRRIMKNGNYIFPDTKKNISDMLSDVQEIG
jgi:hypothetical protein